MKTIESDCTQKRVCHVRVPRPRSPLDTQKRQRPVARVVAGHDAREVEVDSDGEVDARDDLDAVVDLVAEAGDRRDAALGD
eukprot:4844795-Prymnesium_polylepis.1